MGGYLTQSDTRNRYCKKCGDRSSDRDRESILTEVKDSFASAGKGSSRLNETFHVTQQSPNVTRCPPPHCIYIRTRNPPAALEPSLASSRPRRHVCGSPLPLVAAGPKERHRIAAWAPLHLVSSLATLWTRSRRPATHAAPPTALRRRGMATHAAALAWSRHDLPMGAHCGEIFFW